MLPSYRYKSFSISEMPSRAQHFYQHAGRLHGAVKLQGLNFFPGPPTSAVLLGVRVYRRANCRTEIGEALDSSFNDQRSLNACEQASAEPPFGDWHGGGG